MTAVKPLTPGILYGDKAKTYRYLHDPDADAWIFYHYELDLHLRIENSRLREGSVHAVVTHREGDRLFFRDQVNLTSSRSRARFANNVSDRGGRGKGIAAILEALEMAVRAHLMRDPMFAEERDELRRSILRDDTLAYLWKKILDLPDGSTTSDLHKVVKWREEIEAVKDLHDSLEVFIKADMLRLQEQESTGGRPPAPVLVPLP